MSNSETLEDVIVKLVERVIRVENEQIEADLVSVPGVHPGITLKEAGRLSLEVAYQRRASEIRAQYRGIRQRGEWVIDHHPEWGPVYG